VSRSTRARRSTARWALALLLVLGLLAAGPAGAAFADDGDGGGKDNAAVAVNTKDGSSIFKFAFSIAHLMGDVIDTTNAAVAYASCTECKTVAVAIQVVFIESDASTIVPTNVAVAINESCTLCETMASAYQFVVTTGGPVEFTEEGKRRIKAIAKALHDLSKQVEDMTLAEIDAAVDALVAELADILATELVPAHGEDEEDESGPSPSSTASPSPSTATTSPPPTPSPTDSTTVSPEPSGSPSPTASVTP
jgi:putative peptide zinc metalloprotease protein